MVDIDNKVLKVMEGEEEEAEGEGGGGEGGGGRDVETLLK